LSSAPLAVAWADRARAEAISAALEEPQWLLADRLAALESVAKFAAEPNQLFRPYLDLRSVDLAAAVPYEPRAGESGGSSPDGAAALVHIDGDATLVSALGDEARNAGVTIETLVQAAAARPDVIKTVIGAEDTLPPEDGFGQLARALYTHSVVVSIPAGVTLKQPIVLRWAVGESGRALVTRTLIHLGVGAHARIFEEQLASPGGSDVVTDKASSQWWGTTEIVLSDGATLDFAGEQDFGPSTAAFVTRQARMGTDATINWATASVGSRLHRSRIDNVLEGRGSSVRQVEIGFGDGQQLFDLTSYTRHRGADTTSDLLSKGIFTGKSRGYIKGMIEIARSARGTDTFLGEFSMLLDKTSRSVTIPSLEIDQPDVRRAMHSSSVGPIDETQIFYLMSRGLSRDEARKSIVLGFLEPVVARIPMPDAQERLRSLLEAKWPEPAAAKAAA
jgi:Fe-S cluster assembly scaffold protein SufB